MSKDSPGNVVGVAVVVGVAGVVGVVETVVVACCAGAAAGERAPSSLAVPHEADPATNRPTLPSATTQVNGRLLTPTRWHTGRFGNSAECPGGQVAQRGDRLESHRIEAIVLVKIEQAAALVSPAHDDGSTEDEVAQRSLELYGLLRA